MQIRWRKIVISVMALLVVSLILAPSVLADNIKLMIDGQVIKTPSGEPGPLLDQGRTLVPIRIISEKLGAKVDWAAENRQVLIEKKGKTSDMRLDNRLMAYSVSDDDYGVIDVAPRIIKGRTFVPLRVVSYALNVAIDWDDTSKTVSIDSSKVADRQAFFDMEILGIKDGQVIDGKQSLQVSQKANPTASQLRFILANRDTLQGRIIASSNQLDQKLSFLPADIDEGDKLLIAALYDKNGKLVSASHKKVSINLNRKVAITNLQSGQQITGPVDLKLDTNFRARYVKYQLMNNTSGKSILTDKTDPYGTYRFSPLASDNGSWTIIAMAYDRDDQGTSSSPIDVNVQVEPSLSLGGVAAGQTIKDRVTLSSRRNFDVTKTQYIVIDSTNNQERILADMGYGNYTWIPEPSERGTVEVFVRVWDTKNRIMESERIRVTLDPQATLLIQGVGPKAVITADTKIKVKSNVALTNPRLVLTHKKSGKKTSLVAAGSNLEATLVFKDFAQGDYQIRAVGDYQAKTLYSDEVTFRIYTDKIYGPKSIVAKDKFKSFAADMAGASKEKTSMSAALQTAQAILETGWGQSVPVDKYTGKFSNNLFGIKGSTNYGSVTSNTWEEYNGVTFRTDAAFRAYKNPQDSWDDHKALLLGASRYQIFRDVMADPVMGAYAIRRAGYATDSLYPQKLMDIMDTYNLWVLDQGNI